MLTDQSPLTPSLLLIGPDFHQYCESIARAIEEQDIRVKVIKSPVHTPTGLVNRITIDLARFLRLPDGAAAWRRRFNASVLARARELRPDYLLVIKGDWLDPETFSQIPAANKAIWFQDAARRCGPDHLALSKLAKAVFVFEGDDIDYLAQNGVDPSRSHFLPLGYDPHIYRPLQDVERTVDISFVGRLYDSRKEIILTLLDRLPHYKLQVWGRYIRYKEPRTWFEWLGGKLSRHRRHVFMNRDISPEQVNHVYAQSRIVLNLHHEQSRSGCNPRVFEIIGSGAFQICDDNQFVRQHVTDSIVQFGDIEELIARIDYYLRNDEERHAIAAKTSELSERFTFRERTAELISLLARN